MATKGEITAGWNKLYKLWDIKGGCETCRYHGLLSEHDLCDDDITEALDKHKGILDLWCVEDSDHWGFTIDISPDPQTT